MTENNKNLGTDGFDPSKVNKLSAKEILKRVGPGIVLTGVVIGPGNITTSAMIGANYGYSLIWLIIPILIMGVTFMLTSYRISMLTGMPILHAIRHYYGKVASGFCGVALFLSCLFFTLGNISGTGAGMNLVFGINWKLGALIMLAVLTVLYFSKGVYSKVEKGILICGTGIGISITANKIKGIRAALCSDTFSAHATREHNDANILAMGARVVGEGLALDIVDTFLETEFSNDERHIRRINMIED